MRRRVGVALTIALLGASCLGTAPEPTSSPASSASASPVAETPPAASAAAAALAHIDVCALPTEQPRSAGIRGGEHYARIEGNSIWLEGADSLLAKIDAVAVVAPDARAIAFWAPDLSDPNAVAVLTVLDLLTGVRRSYAVQNDERGSPIAWSCDGAALLLIGRKDDPPPTGGIFIPGAPIYAALRLFDLRTGTERELARFAREDVLGLAWNPGLGVAAAVVRGESPSGHFSTYLAVHDNGTIGRWTLPSERSWPEVLVDASASRVFAVGGSLDPSTTSALLRWPADDGSHPVSTPAPSGRTIGVARSVAGSSDLIVVLRENKVDPEQRAELWPQDPQSTPRPLLGTLTGQDLVGLIPRSDGSTYVSRTSYQTGLIDVRRVEPAGRVEVTSVSDMVPEPGESLVISDRAIAALRPARLTATFSRAAAIDSVARLTDKVKRVDRTDAKLIEWRDAFLVDGKITRGWARPDQRVWVVALAGRVEAVTGTGRIPLRWGAWYIDADSGAIIDFSTDGRETFVWPGWWDELIDRGPDQPPRTLPAPHAGRPIDFFPQSPCGFATSTMRVNGQLEWLLDCTPDLDREARRTIGPMLERALWTPCGSGLATASWRRREVITTVVEGSGVAPNYIRISQRPRSPGEC